ncbi:MULTISPECIES: hypothetical protein [Rhodomicrobium]|uniref:hypothetical protein n=1 Tax=Rhodomicrobium TaxID=1068 RepID=UPI000B4B1BB4|nr:MULTISPECIES: hypothetical protein [Rhodomicrobium]
MGEPAEKIRLTTGVFYDLGSLLMALGDFLDLGLAPENLRIAAPALAMAPGSALYEALTARGAGLAALVDPSSAPGPIDGLFTGDIGAILTAHLENGAIVATAISASPAIQDQCTRVLLRHCRHTVHAQDHPQPALRPGGSGAIS